MANRQVIAIDIDDVLAINAPAFLQYSNQHWGTKLTIDDYSEHWGDMWKVDHAEWTRRTVEYHDSGLIGRLELVPEALRVIRKLAQDFKLVITTSRRSQVASETQSWIDTYFSGLFEEVHFAGMWDKVGKHSHLATKAELCQQIGADFLIDDQPKHCLAAASVGLQALLFGEYPWSKEIPETDGLVRVKDWQAVLGFFDGK